MCDRRSFDPSSFSAAWEVEAHFSTVSLSDGPCNLCSLVRCLTAQDATPCSEGPLNECGRPHDTLSCLLFTALWLRQSQSILVQEMHRTKDVDLTSYTTFPIKPTIQVELMSLSGPWLQLWDLMNPALHLPMKIQMTNIRKALFQLVVIAFP